MECKTFFRDCICEYPTLVFKGPHYQASDLETLFNWETKLLDMLLPPPNSTMKTSAAIQSIGVHRYQCVQPEEERHCEVRCLVKSHSRREVTNLGPLNSLVKVHRTSFSQRGKVKSAFNLMNCTSQIAHQCLCMGLTFTVTSSDEEPYFLPKDETAS